MKPEITDIYSFVSVFNIRVHFYLIRAERNVLIDTGTKFSPQNDILPVLKKAELTLADIDYILNSHGHIDHIGGNAVVKKAGKARIFIHAEEAAAVENHKLFFENFFSPIVERVWGKELVNEEWGRYSSLGGEEITVDRKVKENDIIELGEGCTLRVLHLPGHTSGSLGYYWEKEGIIFTGDALPGLHEEDGSLPILTDIEAYKSSVKRLMDLPIRTIMQAHDHRGIATAPSHIKQGAEVKQYLSDGYEAAERIDEAIRNTLPQAAGKPFAQIYDEVVAKLPPKLNFKPISQLGAVPLFSSFIIYFSLKRMNG